MCRNWQTRQTQNLLSIRVCGFESHHRHQTSTARETLMNQKLAGFSLSHHHSIPASEKIFQIVTIHGPGAAHSNNSGRYLKFAVQNRPSLLNHFLMKRAGYARFWAVNSNSRFISGQTDQACFFTTGIQTSYCAFCGSGFR